MPITVLFIDMAERFRKKWKKRVSKYRRPFTVLYLYGLLIYLPLLILRLTNDLDGLWNQDDYVAGTWELSIGRWFWPWLDRARFGISLDPLPGILALVLYVAGFLLILRILGYRPDCLVSYLAGFLFMTATPITCQMSHGYMVITFSVSFLLAVSSVYIIAAHGARQNRQIDSDICPVNRKNRPVHSDMRQENSFKSFIPSAILSGVLIALMMGCYQAGIGTTCLVALFYFMRLLTGQAGEKQCSGNPIPDAFRFALRMLIAIVVGAVFYEILLHLHLNLFHVSLSNYQGFSEIGPAYMAAHLGVGIRHAYQEVIYFFFSGIFKFNLFQTRRWFRIFYLVPVIPCIWNIAKIVRKPYTEQLSDQTGSGRTRREKKGRDKVIRLVLYILSLIMIPLFAGSFYLLAPEAETHMQMLLPYALILPLLLCGWNDMELTGQRSPKAEETAACKTAGNDGYKKGLHNRAANAAAAIFMIGSFFLLWGAIGMNEADQYAMYAGRRSTAAIAENILNNAQALGQDPIAGEFEIIGVPAKSPLFSVKDLYYRANNYAQFGNWSDNVSFARVSWRALYRRYLRTNVVFAEGDTEKTISELPEISSMPVFPTAGSIQNLYGVTVIRIAE